jgi:glycosyltransferase involved in cell wall biosynthesis
MNLTSDEVICVSEYVWKSINVKKKSTIVYNSLDHNFVKKAYDFQKSNLNDIPNILMICSLREYKGVNIFVDLASALPQYQFTLVLNSDLQSIKQYIRGKNTNLSNLHIYPKQNNTSLFYEHSDLLLNLSLVDQWIETFGLTILEGMSYGIPCIGPTMGGPPEIITDDIEGYLVDSRDFNTLKNRIIQLLTNEDLYFTFSENARNKSKNFSDLNMRSKIIEIIERNLRT